MADPREIEQFLVDAASAALGLDDLGSDDNFLDAGGNSLAAMWIGARFEDSYGVEFPLELLFESQTLHEVAASVAAIPPPDAAETR